MDFPREWFHDEVRDGFYISGMVKRDWASQMEILHTLDEICRKHHLRWFMAFGALLGTVRHHGFIPWDDDLDIFMPADDFEKFDRAVQTELPVNYYVDNCCNRKSHGFISVFGYQYQNGYHEKEMEMFHDFPYPPSIDVFRLSYVSDDAKEEQWRDDCVKKVMSAAAYFQGEIAAYPKPAGADAATMTIGELRRIQSWDEWAKRGLDFLSSVEKKTKHAFDVDAPLVDQIYALLQQLFLYFPASSCGRMAFLPSFINRGVQCFPKEYADHLIRVPFENMEVNIPEEYEAVLIDRFGRDYMVPFKGAATHAYPGFKHFEENMLARSGMTENPFVYTFQKTDLKDRSADGTAPKEKARDLIEDLKKLHLELHDVARTGRWQSCFALYHKCEDTALQLGAVLRDARGTGILERVPVEAYVQAVVSCLTYSLQHQPLRKEDLKPMDAELQVLCEAVQKHFLSRMEVLFLPTTADRWPAMESLWRSCCEDPACDVTVMPLPYYEKDGLCGIRGDAICERDQFSKETGAISFRDYNIAAHHPDYIFIQSPCDQYNYITTVAPAYYSTILQEQTDHLIYLPWFTTCEFGSKDLDTVQMQFYARMPGVVRADLIIVQSENIRDRYVESLTTFAGEDTRSVWQRKIQGWGTPLQEKAGMVSHLWERVQAFFETEKV